MLDRVRADGDQQGADSETLKTASIAVVRAMSRYLDAIMEAGPARADIEKLMRLQHRATNLGALYDFARRAGGCGEQIAPLGIERAGRRTR